MRGLRRQVSIECHGHRANQQAAAGKNRHVLCAKADRTRVGQPGERLGRLVKAALRGRAVAADECGRA